jgi:hypothetical protein
MTFEASGFEQVVEASAGRSVEADGSQAGFALRINFSDVQALQRSDPVPRQRPQRFTRQCFLPASRLEQSHYRATHGWIAQPEAQGDLRE